MSKYFMTFQIFDFYILFYVTVGFGSDSVVSKIREKSSALRFLSVFLYVGNLSNCST